MHRVGYRALRSPLRVKITKIAYNFFVTGRPPPRLHIDSDPPAFIGLRVTLISIYRRSKFYFFLHSNLLIFSLSTFRMIQCIHPFAYTNPINFGLLCIFSEIQGYPQRMRLQELLNRILTGCFHVYL